MEIRQLTPDFAVAPQIGPEHVKPIAEAGFKSLICNRPDSEEGAVDHALIEAAAHDAGLEFRFVPVVSGSVTPQDVADMTAAIDALPRPILAYCRSGTRSMNLYMLVERMRD